MPLIGPKAMFERAYKEGFAVGAFNVNNMEIIQGIMEAGAAEKSPLILQVSAGARKYAGQNYIVKLIEAALMDTDLPVVLHLDHGPDFELCKACIDGGFTSVMIDGSHLPYEENIAVTKKVVEYAHPRGVWVEAELGRIEGVEDDGGNECQCALVLLREGKDLIHAAPPSSLLARGILCQAGLRLVLDVGERRLRKLLLERALRIVQVAIEDMVDVAADRARRIRVIVEVEELLVVKRLDRLEDVKERDLVERACDLDAARAARDLDEPGLLELGHRLADDDGVDIDTAREEVARELVLVPECLDAGKDVDRDGEPTRNLHRIPLLSHTAFNL